MKSANRQTAVDTKLNPTRVARAIGALVVLWMDFYWVFHREWAVNEQYSYGFLVPFLAAYLMWRRWEERPARDFTYNPPQVWATALVAPLLLIVPLRIILAGSPDWRLALWMYAAAVVAASLSLAGRMGGWRWAKHFALPCALLLFAVPWPTGVEGPLVRGLMGAVSAVTVEGLNLLGIYAEQHGNIIRLANANVGVEEACSGVRSFQSTLMAAFLLGEFFRWRVSWRAGLIVAGCLVSALLNLGRAFTLTLVTAKQGPEAMDAIHDPIGHFVSIAAFLMLLGMCALIERFLGAADDQGAAKKLPKGHLRRSPLAAPVAFWTVVLLLAISHLVSAWWYWQPGLSEAKRFTLQTDWSALAVVPDEKEIDPAVRALLRYSEGEKMEWVENGRHWIAFYFRWEEGRVSSHVGVHRPENCLPSLGYQSTGSGAPLSVEVDRTVLDFSANSFEAMGVPVQVFYAVWDQFPEYAVPMGSSASDRLAQAWRGQRIRGRQSLQLVVMNEPDVARAREQARSIAASVLQSEVP